MTLETLTIVFFSIILVLSVVAARRRECRWQGRYAEALRTGEEQASRLAETLLSLTSSREQIAELETRLEEALSSAAQIAPSAHDLRPDTTAPVADSGLREHVAALADRLTGQVVTALSEAEQAVSEAIEAFAHIAADAGDAAAGAQAIIGGGSDSGITQVAGRATEIMGGFVHGMLITARQVSKSADQIQELVAASQNLYGLLDEVEKVADRTMLLSLNASLEAARAGQAGRGFAVVAGEVRTLADRSRLAAERMRVLTAEITSASGDVSKNLGLSAERSLEESCQAQVEINRLLQSIQDGDRAAQQALLTLGDKSRQVSNDIGRIIIAFQFHDLLRQRLEHVADPLCALRDSLRGEDGSEAAMTAPPLSYAVGQNTFSARAVGAAPTLAIVNYAAETDDNITLF